MMFPLLEAILFSFPPILRTVSTRRRGEDTERVEQIWFFWCVCFCVVVVASRQQQESLL